MPNWITDRNPPSPGVYRVLEPRAKVWYAMWTGTCWLLGDDNIEDAARETTPRLPPAGWRPARLREHQRAEARVRAALEHTPETAPPAPIQWAGPWGRKMDAP